MRARFALLLQVRTTCSILTRRRPCDVIKMGEMNLPKGYILFVHGKDQYMGDEKEGNYAMRYHLYLTLEDLYLKDVLHLRIVI